MVLIGAEGCPHSYPGIGRRIACQAGTAITLSDPVTIPLSAGVADRLTLILTDRLLCRVTGRDTIRPIACTIRPCTPATTRRCNLTIICAMASTAVTWKLPVTTRHWNAFTGTWKSRATGDQTRRITDPEPGHDHGKGDDLIPLTEGGHRVLLSGRRATAHHTVLRIVLLTALLTGLRPEM